MRQRSCGYLTGGVFRASTPILPAFTAAILIFARWLPDQPGSILHGRLGENSFYHLAVDIGEPEVTALEPIR